MHKHGCCSVHKHGCCDVRWKHRLQQRSTRLFPSIPKSPLKRYILSLIFAIAFITKQNVIRWIKANPSLEEKKCVWKSHHRKNDLFSWKVSQSFRFSLRRLGSLESVVIMLQNLWNWITEPEPNLQWWHPGAGSMSRIRWRNSELQHAKLSW